MHRFVIVMATLIGAAIALGAMWAFGWSIYYIFRPSNTMPGPIAEMVFLFVDIALSVAAIVEVIVIAIIANSGLISNEQAKVAGIAFSAIALLGLLLLLILYKRVYAS